MKLFQVQCQREGDIFYVQHQSEGWAAAAVRYCPVCGSRRVRPTGRSYPGVNETKQTRKGE